MNGAGSFSNSSFGHENSWFGGRSKPPVSRIDIENDLYRGNTSPNFLSACSSFLQLRLHERLGNDNSITTQFIRNNINQNTSTSNFESCSVLNFANSCIQLQNVENYSHHIEKEISNSTDGVLHIDQILPPLRESKTNLFYSVFLKNVRNQFTKFKNIFKTNKVIITTKKSHLEIKCVTQATQTDLCSKKFKHIKKPNASSSTTLKGRSSRMSMPEEVKEYQSWKAKFSNEMKTKRHQRIFKCPMAKCNSCMEVVETKVQTKKFTKMRRQSSKLSVLNEDREYDDEFEAYWSQVKLKNSSRF